MNKIFCFILLCFSFSFTFSTSTYYIDQTTKNNNGDGSRDNAFGSLDDAVANLGVGNFELVFLGKEARLSRAIQIPKQAIYIIRPDTISPGQAYFPLIFEIGANITISNAIMTVEGFQIIALDTNADPMASLLQINKGSVTLKNIQVSDIVYNNDVSFSFLTTDYQSEVIISQCEFENLVNVQIWIIGSKLTISNSKFSSIEMDLGDFIVMYDIAGEGMEATFSNLSVDPGFRRSNFNENGLISLLDCNIDIRFDGLTIQDITLVNGNAFIGSTYSQGFQFSYNNLFELSNIHIENVFESFSSQALEEPTTGYALVFDMIKTTSYRVSNFSAKNVRLRYAPILQFSSGLLGQSISDSKKILSSAQLKNIKLESCTNANFGFSSLNEINIQNIELLENSVNDTNIDYPLFRFINASKVLVQNVYASKQNGPVFKFLDVLSHQLLDCQFDEATSSHLFPISSQNLIEIQRTKDTLGILGMGLEPNAEAITVFKNFNLNGFTDMYGMTSANRSNDTYFIVIRSEVGEVYIQDSIWKNIEFGGLLSTQMNYLKVENLTVTTDPSATIYDIAWHSIFQFVNLREFEVASSNFIWNKNLNILNVWNIPRGELFDIVEVLKLRFDRVNVIGNVALAEEDESTFSSLFVVHSSLKTVEITFSNSHFKNNMIATGIILTEESNKANINLINNTFEDNNAEDIGTIFVAKMMLDEISNLEIHNNVFKNNVCKKNGGVFGFINTRHTLNASSNTYDSNSAGLAGGVGYALKSWLSVFEANSNFINNLAGTNGGAWYARLSFNQGRLESLTFVNSTFKNLTALRKGGAISITSGNLILEKCLFEDNRALLAGGDIYLVSFASIRGTSVIFINSNAPEGALLYSESLYGQGVILENIQVSNNISNLKSASVLIEINSGVMSILHSQFSSISLSIMRAVDTSIIIDGVSFKQINCLSQQSFCILHGGYNQVFLSNIIIENVQSNSDIITLNPSNQKMVLDNVNVHDIKLYPKDENTNQLFVFKISQAKDVNIKNNQFTQLVDFSSVLLRKSTFSILNTLFSNQPTNGQQLIKSSPIEHHYLVLDSSHGSIVNTSFIGNGKNTKTNGGAINIEGSHGEYEIENCYFQGNQGYDGGAISIDAGAAENFSIRSSSFESNQALVAGGAIYFANLSVKNPVIINKSFFSKNEAITGGAVFIAEQDVLIDGSSFQANKAVKGGAIASFALGDAKVFLKDAIFRKNTAKVGPAVTAFGKKNFLYSKSKKRNSR